MSFFIPKYKYQLIEFFKKHRPDWKVSGWTKKKLFAVYFSERKKG